MSKTGMIEIERVRRFEKRMNQIGINQLSTMLGSILYIYILSRTEYMQAQS